MVPNMVPTMVHTKHGPIWSQAWALDEASHVTSSVGPIVWDPSPGDYWTLVRGTIGPIGGILDPMGNQHTQNMVPNMGPYGPKHGPKHGLLNIVPMYFIAYYYNILMFKVNYSKVLTLYRNFP
jgi:hypothetical protein